MDRQDKKTIDNTVAKKIKFNKKYIFRLFIYGCVGVLIPIFIQDIFLELLIIGIILVLIVILELYLEHKKKYTMRQSI